MSGKAHLDVEAAVRPGPRAERGAVGAGDGPDDGETKPVTVSVADPLAAKLPEWLEQPAQLVGRDQYAGVATEITARPALLAVEIFTRPPATDPGWAWACSLPGHSRRCWPAGCGWRSATPSWRQKRVRRNSQKPPVRAFWRRTVK